MWNAIKLRQLFIFYLLLILISGNKEVGSQNNQGQLFFAAVAGKPVEGKTPILLRWYVAEGQLPTMEFSIYRKEGNAVSNSPLTQLSVTSKLRNVSLIRSILEQSELKQAYDDLINVLTYMMDVPVTPDNYVEQLLQILDGTEDCGSCTMRRNMLVQANYGVAIVEGLGYLDLAEAKTYTYELRTSTTGAQDDLVVGRVTIDASKPTQLPPPQQPVELELPGEKGHLRIFLRWDETPQLKQLSHIMFGYNVYRGSEQDGGENFENLLAQGKLKKINRLPILPPSAQARGTKPEEDFMFVDDNLSMSKLGPEGDPFLGGEQYYYWVVARDLLGQNGQSSQSVLATVEDKSGPTTPRGLHTDLVDDQGVQKVGLVWDRNIDDTVSYRIYRFQLYENIGKTTPFPAVNGMTEGYIGDVPQPPADPPFYLDPSIKLPEHENLAFWYSVAAVDAAGNMSPLSPPVRGVIFDTTPPPPPAMPELCSYYSRCWLEEWTLANTTLSATSTIQVQFNISRRSSNVSAIEIERQTLLNGVGDYAVVYHGDFPPNVDHLEFREWLAFDPIIIPSGIIPSPTDIVDGTDYCPPYLMNKNSTDDISHDDSAHDSHGDITIGIFNDIIGSPTFVIQPTYNYRITLYDAAGARWDTYDMPPEYIDTLNSHIYNLYFQILVTGEAQETCMQGGILDHTPNENGNRRAIRLKFPKTDDAAGIILYRSPNCIDYYPVVESRFLGNASVSLVDDYRPEQGAQICYAAQTYDENNNLSSLIYIPGRIRIPAGNVSKIVPSMQSAEPVGDASLPKLDLKWFGPTTGIAGFWVYFGDYEELNGTETIVYLGQNEFEFDPKDNIYRAVLDITDDKSKEKIAVNRNYIIRVKALLQNGEERLSNNTVTFNWAMKPRLETHPVWPIRPLPPKSSALVAVWIPPYEGGDENPPFTYGVGLNIGNFTFRPTNLQYRIQTPFIVYRKRVDVPGTYIQVSPLIFQPTIEDNFNQPFFYLRSEQQPDGVNIGVIYFLDTVNLINGAIYEYKIVRVWESSGELVEEIGPSNQVQVVDP